MSLQIRTFVQGTPKFLDLYKDEPLLLSLSFAEIQDITKKNSTFSKGFSVPGSQRNNEIFNFFYDLNSVPLTFNPNNKFEAILMWDGYEILQGYIRLNGVSINNDEIIYQVTFYNQVGDLAANIGDKFLRNLDLSALSHPYQDSVILESILDPTLFPLTGSTNYSYQNGKTFWGLYNIGYEYISGNTVNQNTSPFIQFSPLLSASTGVIYFPTSGNFDFSGTPVNDYYYKPTLQVKTLYETICNEAGYEIQSDFFDTDYFGKFYMPLKFLDETIYSRNAIQACYKYGPQNFVLTSILNTAATQPSSAVTCNSLGFTLSATSFTIPSEFASTYQFRFSWTQIGRCNFGLFQIPTVQLYVFDGVNDIPLYQTQWCTPDPVTVSFDQFFNITGTTNLTFYWRGEYADISGLYVEIVNGPRFIPTGSTINYALEFPDNDYSQIDFITSINKYFNLVVVPNPDKPKSLIVEPIIDYVGKGRVLDWTTKVDANQLQSLYPTSSIINGTLEYEFKLDQDYANQDFNSQANRIFGTDKFKLNLEYKDQTTKFDYMFSSPIDITINNAYVPLLTVSSMSKLKTVDINGTSQQTFVPFKILPKILFRGPTLPNDNWGFVGGVQTVTGSSFCTSGVTLNVTNDGYIKYNDCFGNTTYQFVPVGTTTITACTNPSTYRQGVPYSNLAVFTISSSGTSCSSVTTPAVYQTYFMDQFQIDRFSNYNRFTTYPFNYNDFSHYCNFRGEDKTNITPTEFTFVAEDLYDIYYKPYVDDLISEENKIYSAKIYLYPQEIQQLRWDERILINNTYFRINRITNFNMTEPGICDIELVKLTREYEGHRKLYYDLIPCSTGATLHSNSDLMYHLYTYAGNYVTLYDDSLNYLGCYEVQIGSYNTGYTYNHYFISSGYTGSLVNVYPDCGCTGRTAFNLVQQPPPITGLFFYDGFVCNSGTSITFSSSLSDLDNTGLTYKIFNPVSMTEICVTGVTNSYVQNTDWYEISSHSGCTECACINCYEFSLTANTSGQVKWLDCNGSVDFTTASAGEVLLLQCARPGTIVGDVTISQGYLCSSTCITPTPTITQTLTPTPTLTPNLPATPTPTPTLTNTPTPSSGNFTCKIYTNYSVNSWIGDYQDCSGSWIYSGYVAPSGSICAVINTPVTISGLDLNEGIACTV